MREKVCPSNGLAREPKSHAKQAARGGRGWTFGALLPTCFGALFLGAEALAQSIISSTRTVSAATDSSLIGDSSESFESLLLGPWEMTAATPTASAEQISTVDVPQTSAAFVLSASGNGFTTSTGEATLKAFVNVLVPSTYTISGSGWLGASSQINGAHASASVVLKTFAGAVIYAWEVEVGGFGQPQDWNGSIRAAGELAPGVYRLEIQSSLFAASGGAGSSGFASGSTEFGVDIAAIPPAGLLVPSEYPTIAAAIAAVNNGRAGETIYIAPGVYHEHGLVLSESASIKPYPVGEVVIDGDGATTGILRMTGGQGAETVIEGITFRNSGAGSPLPPAPQFDGGGAILIDNASPRIVDCRFLNNHASYGAAIYALNSAAQFEDCQFEGNSASADGGALQALNAPITVTSTWFVDNSAGGYGGAMHCPFGAGPIADVQITACVFRDNSANLGGAVSFDTTTAERHLRVESTSISCNAAVAAGAIWSTPGIDGLVQASTSSICGNSDPAFVGGAIESLGDNTICGCLGDLNADGLVDSEDLGSLLGDWSGSESDLTCDGVVDSADLGVLLGAWGPC